MSTEQPLSRPDTWQAGDQVTGNVVWTRTEVGKWWNVGQSLRLLDIDVDRSLAAGTLVVSHLSPRTDAEDGEVRTIPVTVEVDSDDLREWANKHADAGDHGVAHVLYAAAREVEDGTYGQPIAPVSPAPVGDMDAAVEAMARRRWRDEHGSPWSHDSKRTPESDQREIDETGYREWDNGRVSDVVKDGMRRLARNMLDAALPHLSPRPAPVATNGCDVCGRPTTHVTTPGGMRGCDDHFGGRP